MTVFSRFKAHFMATVMVLGLAESAAAADICSGSYSTNAPNDAPRWSVVFSEQLGKILCATSPGELSQIAEGLQDHAGLLPIEIIESLFDQITYRREEISFFSDPALVEFGRDLADIVERRFSGPATLPEPRQQAVLMGMEAQVRLVKETEFWIQENPRFSFDDRRVAVGQIFMRLLDDPEFHPSATNDATQ